MTTQTAYVNGLNSLVAALNNTKGVNAETRGFWQKALDKALNKTLHANGTVQSTLSNPLAYFAVPCCSDKEISKGRSKEFTLDQFRFALSKGWQADTDKRLRGIDPDAIAAGLAVSWARKDSALGTRDERREAAKTSHNNMVALLESNQARLIAKREAQKAAKAAKKGNTPPVDDASNQDAGEV